MNRNAFVIIFAVLFMLSFCQAALAQPAADGGSFLTGVVKDATMNVVIVRGPDGADYAFSTIDKDYDRTNLKNGLTVGSTVIVTYEGDLFLDESKIQTAKVLAIADGEFKDTSFIVSDGEEFSFDFDCDGSLEEISFDWEHSGDSNLDIAVVSVKSETYAAKFATEITYNVSALVCDIDPSDGCIDILATGDTMSDDYFTWRLRLQNGELKKIGGTAEGKAEKFLNGKAIFGDWVNTLGTRWYTAAFTPDESGTLVRSEGELWRATGLNYEGTWEYSALETKKDMPVTFIKDGAETNGVLPSGTKLVLTATDDKSKAFFVLKDGVEGRIDIVPSAKGYGFEIDGITDEDYFVFLPYSG